VAIVTVVDVAVVAVATAAATATVNQAQSTRSRWRVRTLMLQSSTGRMSLFQPQKVHLPSAQMLRTSVKEHPEPTVAAAGVAVVDAAVAVVARASSRSRRPVQMLRSSLLPTRQSTIPPLRSTVRLSVRSRTNQRPWWPIPRRRASIVWIVATAVDVIEMDVVAVIVTVADVAISAVYPVALPRRLLFTA
jgi:hypothetical protein